jgi:hypothetical protein
MPFTWIGVPGSKPGCAPTGNGEEEDKVEEDVLEENDDMDRWSEITLCDSESVDRATSDNSVNIYYQHEHLSDGEEGGFLTECKTTSDIGGWQTQGGKKNIKNWDNISVNNVPFVVSSVNRYSALSSYDDDDDDDDDYVDSDESESDDEHALAGR